MAGGCIVHSLNVPVTVPGFIWSVWKIICTWMTFGRLHIFTRLRAVRHSLHPLSSLMTFNMPSPSQESLSSTATGSVRLGGAPREWSALCATAAMLSWLPGFLPSSSPQTQSRMKLMADGYEEDHAHAQHHPHRSHHLHPANVHQRILPRGPSHANHRSPLEVSVIRRRTPGVCEAGFVFVSSS